MFNTTTITIDSRQVNQMSITTIDKEKGMSDKNINVIPAASFFSALNRKRKINNLEEIEDTLLARKLGILFAVNTDNYVNFKGEYIELNDVQLVALQGILDEHFDVKMAEEMQSLIMSLDEVKRKIEAEDIYLTSRPQSSVNPRVGIVSRIKGFFGLKKIPN